MGVTVGGGGCGEWVAWSVATYTWIVGLMVSAVWSGCGRRCGECVTVGVVSGCG